MKDAIDGVVGSHDAEISDNFLGKIQLLPGPTQVRRMIDDGYPVFILMHRGLDFVRIRAIVLVPQQHLDAVDDALHAEFNDDPRDRSLVDRMTREAAIEVVVRIVAV